MYSQISKALYLQLIDNNHFVNSDSEQKEHAIKMWYYCKDIETTILIVDNYLSCTQSYFIQDVNA